MILKLDFKIKNKELQLPISYNHIVQSFIYNNISQKLANFLHNEGYMYKKRIFKFFVFSKLEGKFKLNKAEHKIKFFDGIRIRINSPMDIFCQEFANSMINSDNLNLIGNKIVVDQINFDKPEIYKNEILAKTMSPIVMYSTIEKPNGKKFTYYFQPGDPDYADMISNNLTKKYNALYKKDIKFENIKIKKITNGKMRHMSYKKFAIKAWDGKLKIEGPKELLKLGIESGFGGKNSQGFGYLDIIN